MIPKNELISTHTARRSFITNALRSGTSPARLQGATGQSLKVIDGYNKITEEENADDLRNDAHFQRPSALAV
jgi:hypothetical protein